MGERNKKLIFAGVLIAVIAMLLALLDLIVGFPYQGQMVMDILFLVAGAIVLYMGWDAYQDLR